MIERTVLCGEHNWETPSSAAKDRIAHLYTRGSSRFELRCSLRVPVPMRTLLVVVLSLFALNAWSAPRTVHITGTVANIQSWEIKGYFTAMVVGSTRLPRPGVVPSSPQLMVDRSTGYFNGEIACEVIRNAHGRWVDIHLVNVAPTFQLFTEMVIRVPYARSIHLGTFDWKPSRYRWKAGTLLIDTAVPRDTILGDRFDTHLRISPINPAPGDSVWFEFVWENSGQPHVASLGGLYMKDCCNFLCDLTFAVRTDTDVHGESWPHHVKLYLQPPFEPGRYRVRQVPAQGENLRDVDFLLNKDLYFTVGERTEP